MSYRHVFGVSKIFGVFPFALDLENLKEPVKKSFSGLFWSLLAGAVMTFRTIVPYPVSVYEGDQGILKIIRFAYTATMLVPIYKTLGRINVTADFYTNFFILSEDVKTRRLWTTDSLALVQLVINTVKTALFFSLELSLYNLFLAVTELWVSAVEAAETALLVYVVVSLQKNYEYLVKRVTSLYEKAAFTRSSVRRARGRLGQLLDLSRETDSTFGLRNFVTIMLAAVSLLKLTYSLLLQLGSRFVFDSKFAIAVLLNCEQMIRLLTLTYCCSRLKENNVPLSREIMKINTGDITAASMNELEGFVEDLNFHRPKITANGCYCIELPLLYSIAGALVSFILIVAPGMTKK